MSQSQFLFRFVQYEDLSTDAVDKYKSWSRTQLADESTALRTQLKHLKNVDEERSERDRVLEAEELAKAEEICYFEAHVAKLLNDKDSISAKREINAQERDHGELESESQTCSLQAVEYMLRHDPNKPYALKPLSRVQSETKLRGPHDTAKLGYNDSIGKLNELRNLGLEQNADFPDTSIRTGKGNGDVHELHARINFYVGFEEEASNDVSRLERVISKYHEDKTSEE